MKLIISDRHLDIPEIKQASVECIDLSKLKIANCIGCFGCWVKTPGKCVIRDDATKVYPRIAESDTVLYVSKVKFGSYDLVMKTMLERSIPIQQAFIRLFNGETHHVQRNVAPKQAIVLGYGDISPEERDVFCQLIARNANNMNFAHYRVRFATEQGLEEAVREEVLKWGAQ